MKIAKYPESQKLTAKYRDMSVLLLGSDSAETIFVVEGKTEKKSSFGLFIDPILKWLAETLIPQSKERRWIFVYLCQSPWKSPSTSVIRCFVQLKRAMSQSHTWKPGWRFCGRAKGNSKALDALSRVSAWVPITNNIFQPHRIGHFAPGQKVPKPLFLYFFARR